MLKRKRTRGPRPEMAAGHCGDLGQQGRGGLARLCTVCESSHGEGDL